MPQSDYVEVTGPDNQTYHFPTGTTKEAAIAYFKKKGIGVSAIPTAKAPGPQMSDFKRRALAARSQYPVGQVSPGSHTPVYPGGEMGFASRFGLQPSNIAENIGSSAVGMAKTLGAAGKDLLSNPNWFATMPAGQRPSTMQKFVTEPAKAEIAKAKAAPTLLEKAGHYGAAALPMIGPMAAQIGEQAGHSDIGGAAGQVVGMLATGKVAKETGEFVVDKATDMISADSLWQRAAKLDTKVLQTAKGGAKNYNLATGLQVAKESIVATLKNLPTKIEAKRLAKDAQVRSLARQLDASGRTVDISQDIAPIARDVMDVANNRAQLTPQLSKQIRGLLDRVTTKVDMQTGQRVARNLQNLTVSDALQLQKGLEDLSAFGKDTPEAINNLARRIRGVIGDKLNQASPQMQRLRGEESNLITARDAARDKYAKVLNDGRTMARGFIYSNMPAVAAYLGLKAMGLSFGPAIGSIVVLRTLAESTYSRTLRAALYAKAAGLIDAALGRSAAPSGPLQPTSPTGGPLAPQGPQSLGPQGFIGQNVPPRPSPINMGVANASVVTPPLLTRGTLQLSEKASKAAAGSGKYPRVPKEPQGSYLAEKAKAEKMPPGYYGEISLPSTGEPRGREISAELGADIPTGRKTSPRESREELYRRLTWTMAEFLEKPTAENRLKVEAAGREYSEARGKALGYDKKKAVEAEVSVAKSNIKSAAEGADARTKAMLDRLDTIQSTKPTSGAHANALKREAEEIKGLLSGELKGSEASAARKRIADRERLAGKRETMKAEATPEKVAQATQAGSASMAASPEDVAMLRGQREKLLQAGYAKLATFEGGPEFVKALQKQAADMHKAGATDYDEVTALAEAINALKEASGQ